MKQRYSYFLFCGLLAVMFAVGGQSAHSAANMANAQKGKILLQVEKNGEAWYVNPADEMRYFMGRPEDAFILMRQLGVGITTGNLDKIRYAAINGAGPDQDGDGLSDLYEDAIGSDKTKIDSDNDGYADKVEVENGFNPLGAGSLKADDNFSGQQKGRILLQVEGNGEAWYVNPADGLRYFMGRPADAFALMRQLGLGISNANLERIAIKSGPADNTTPESSPAQAPANSELSKIIADHQAMVKSFIASYDADDYTTYGQLSEKTFTAAGAAKAEEKVSDFFSAFTLGLKRINRLDLNEEYQFAQDNGDPVLPYDKIDDQTIVIGLGIEDINPYELKLEGGKWKVDLKLAESYYNEAENLASIEVDAEGSELELYLMGKIKPVLQAYKKSHGNYPSSLEKILITYPALKDYLDMFYYAVSSDGIKCHYGIEVYDDEAQLAKDSDFDSLAEGFDNGFEGDDPIYDIVM